MREESDERAFGPEQDFFQEWVNESYGKNSRTKTVTLDKHRKICSMLQGLDTTANAKFRFWVRTKGFVLLSNDGKELGPESIEEGLLYIKIKDEVSSPCPTKYLSMRRPNSHSSDVGISVYRKVAIVEDFYDIIRAVHVDVDGIHAGQKKTYRMVSDQYCFLPREVVTFYLLHCQSCRPRIEKYGPLASKRKLEELRQHSHDSSEEKNDDDLDELDQSDDSGSVSPSPTELKTSPRHEKALKLRSENRACGRKLTYSLETDDKLYQWVRNQTALGEVVTKEKLKEQALALVQVESPDFKASNGWLEKFLTRHSIVLSGTKQVVPNSPKAADSDWRKNGDQHTSQGAPTAAATTSLLLDEGIIKEPPHLHELLQQVTVQSSANSSGSAASIKDEEEDNDDDDDDDVEGDTEDIATNRHQSANPERLKAFNMFVRLFVDENLDRLVPISKQPKEKIGAIILSCQRQFPEFGDRARKRIRTYLKSCRRSSRLKEPLKRTADNMSSVTAHIPSTQLSEVNNILAKACHSESHEAAKRSRLDVSPQKNSIGITAPRALIAASPLSQVIPTKQQGALPLPGVNNSAIPAKFSQQEITAVQQLIIGYRESASFLHRSADELENLLRQSKAYHNQTH